MVSRPAHLDGLGFGLKWDMGWMHDTLQYMAHDPAHRKWHHRNLYFRMLYAWHENFALPLSHDEVVHMKGSLLGRMPGDAWRKFANLRTLYAYMWTRPGKKLLFMGSELAPWTEWNHDASLEWHLASQGGHQGVFRLVEALGGIYRTWPCLWKLDFDSRGFQWIDCTDRDASVVSYVRRDGDGGELLVVLNPPRSRTTTTVWGRPEGGAGSGS